LIDRKRQVRGTLEVYSAPSEKAWCPLNN